MKRKYFCFWISVTPETEERWRIKDAIKELIKEDRKKLVAKPKKEEL